MRLPDLMATGWAEIGSHKMRSFLSIFAIAIGIATFFYSLSVLSQHYRHIGQAAEIAGDGRVETSTAHPLSMTQYNDLLARLPEGSSLSFITTSWAVGYGENNLYHHRNLLVQAEVRGILPTWKDTDFVYRLEGRFINWNDIVNHHHVVVLPVFPHDKKPLDQYIGYYGNIDIPSTDLTDYTSHHNLLHQQVLLKGQVFTVVGLLHFPMEEDDARLSYMRDEVPYLFIPYTTWYDISPQEEDTREVTIRVVPGQESLARVVANTLVSYLRAQFGPEEKPKIKFFYDELQRYFRKARQELNNMFFMGLVAMIAGGIGIMNVTIAVIFSRTKEIGIRRALGASRRDILFQFVVEAMLLGLCGAVFGMILGYMAVLHLAQNTHQMTFSWWVVALSVLIALVTSFLFALYPAWKAAKLRPVDALKN